MPIYTNTGCDEEGRRIANCIACNSNGVDTNAHTCTIEEDEADYGDFHGCCVNFETEYHSARKLMGLKTTNMSKLMDSVMLLYVNAPPKWETHYVQLIREIEHRQAMLMQLRLGVM